ncbi:MAG: response regulator transcription factor [Proteobacteria bacterium]|nr:response regulator transcription factor [Pseudomonadota bacterium]
MFEEKSVLIIEDDQDIAGLLDLHLRDLGCKVEVENNGANGLESVLTKHYDLLILDLTLPGVEGLEICKQLRSKNQWIPVLMLTARSEILDKVLGLELGADDYITKPFSIRELIARVKVILRRTNNFSPIEVDNQILIDAGGLKIDLKKRKVLLDKQVVELTAKEFDLLVEFVKNPGRCFSRQELLESVWGYHFQGYDHTVNAHINRLRAKIEIDPSSPRYIQTVWGVGYKFSELEEL